jgi:hypothetical protein
MFVDVRECSCLLMSSSVPEFCVNVGCCADNSGRTVIFVRTRGNPRDPPPFRWPSLPQSAPPICRKGKHYLHILESDFAISMRTFQIFPRITDNYDVQESREPYLVHVLTYSLCALCSCDLFVILTTTSQGPSRSPASETFSGPLDL